MNLNKYPLKKNWISFINLFSNGPTAKPWKTPRYFTAELVFEKCNNCLLMFSNEFSVSLLYIY